MYIIKMISVIKQSKNDVVSIIMIMSIIMKNIILYQ